MTSVNSLTCDGSYATGFISIALCLHTSFSLFTPAGAWFSLERAWNAGILEKRSVKTQNRSIWIIPHSPNSESGMQPFVCSIREHRSGADSSRPSVSWEIPAPEKSEQQCKNSSHSYSRLQTTQEINWLMTLFTLSTRNLLMRRTGEIVLGLGVTLFWHEEIR